MVAEHLDLPHKWLTAFNQRDMSLIQQKVCNQLASWSMTKLCLNDQHQAWSLVLNHHDNLLWWAKYWRNTRCNRNTSCQENSLYPHCRRIYSKINPQWGWPISPVTSYSKGAESPNLAPGSPATNLALVSKLPLPWESPGRSVRSRSQNCWKSTLLGPGVRGVSAGNRVRPFLNSWHSTCEAGPRAPAPDSMSASSTGDSVGERLMYWSSRGGGIRGGNFQTQICTRILRERLRHLVVVFAQGKGWVALALEP